MPQEPIINDSNYAQFVGDPVVGGDQKARGLWPRNYSTHPVGCYGSALPYTAVTLPLIPREEWIDRINDAVTNQSQISDVMKSMNVPCLDQNGKGYCWGHSVTGCMQALRALMHLPTVGLSAYAVCCIIKGYRDEGGWGAEALDFVTQRGVPSEQFWPQRSMSRSNDNAATWANAALHKATEGWVDLSAAQYDRNLSFDQVISLLLSRCPVVGDFNWWGHSVMLCDACLPNIPPTASKATLASLPDLRSLDMNDPKDAAAMPVGDRIRNSWGEGWGDRGYGILQGSKCVPDGSVAPRATIPSPA